MFKDISRFTRETKEGLKKYMDLMDKGVELVFIDNPTFSTGYIQNLLNIAQQQEDLIARTSMEFIVKILLIAELDRVEKERLTIVKRTKDGMAASPNKPGRRPGQLDKLSDALVKDIKQYMTDRDITQVSLMKKYKISRNTLRKYIKMEKEGTLETAARAERK